MWSLARASAMRTNSEMYNTLLSLEKQYTRTILSAQRPVNRPTRNCTGEGHEISNRSVKAALSLLLKSAVGESPSSVSHRNNRNESISKPNCHRKPCATGRVGTQERERLSDRDPILTMEDNEVTKDTSKGVSCEEDRIRLMSFMHLKGYETLRDILYYPPEER